MATKKKEKPYVRAPAKFSLAYGALIKDYGLTRILKNIEKTAPNIFFTHDSATLSGGQHFITLYPKGTGKGVRLEAIHSYAEGLSKPAYFFFDRETGQYVDIKKLVRKFK